MKSGTIKQLKSEPNSGLAELIFTDGSSVLVESGFGCRQLLDAIEGLEPPITIQYEINEHHVMTGFDIEIGND